MANRFRTLVGVSAGLTFLLILLGVYTAAAGAGLTCNARWPLCDGAVFGLFPANWPSFIEWFHRLVAMVTGFVILGATVAAWRTGAERRVLAALAVATFFLPSQIVLGALTVTRYELLILTAHFVTAMTIFTGVVLAAVWTFEGGPGRTRRAAGVALVALPIVAALTPRLLVVYDASAQVAYYAAGLLAFAAVLATTVWADEATSALARVATGLSTAVLFCLLVVGRQVLSDTAQALALAGAVLAFALTGVALWLTARTGAAGPRSGGLPDGD
ncbi:COX15/CtaA family protein [Halomarina ordinaria]|uniref:COX15/CtaA family protein n=1 Tax=Halomarina ordinaria TaxID=3033939 RepID=A0ABD5UB60_9EURY|nr:COX15/CtaA family protein [Halomarina sp. PSRA2]